MLIPALLIILIGLVGFVAWKSMQTTGPTESANELKLESELERMTERVGELTNQLRDAEKERDELSGKNKLLFVGQTKLQAERDTLGTSVADFKAHENQNKKDFDRRIEDLNNAKRALDDEKARVRNEDEERKRIEEEERDRVWNDHEQNVIAHLRDLCKKPEYYFTSHDNKDLPAGFDGSLKPDFLIEFLDQYVIFDAKASKAKSLQTYISDAVKKTTEKIRDNARIAKFVFLVVPTDAISELKTYQYMQDGYTFYVISPEALGPVLGSLKRITTYELAEKLDPKDRENIINIIAKFDTYISFRNALDILLAEQGTNALEDIAQLSSDLEKDIADRKEKNGVPTFKPSEVKRLMSTEERIVEIAALTNPQPKIMKKTIEKAKNAVMNASL